MADDQPPRRDQQRAAGRTLKEFLPLRPAEQKLRDACRTGEVARISVERPDKKTKDNSIRPGFLRFLALGGDGDVPIHEQGVQLRGGWIDSAVDLEACRVGVPIALWNCAVAGTLIVRRADLFGLALDGSRVAGIAGDGLRCGYLHLRADFHASGEVRLLGANIGGGLACNGGRFDNANGAALNCDGIEIGGSIFLRDGFHATGEVRLLNANIGGDLTCDGGRFETAQDYALMLNRAKIGGGFHFRDIKSPTAGQRGVASLLATRAGTLTDDAASWEKDKFSELILDGFRYDRIAGVPPTNIPNPTPDGDAPPRDANTRIAWLDRQIARHLKQDFRPQPWRQLARVLMDMGHENDAKTILIDMRKRQRASEWKYREEWRRKPCYWLKTRFDWGLGVLVGYGYRPMRALWALAGLWIVGSVIYSSVAALGIMAPTDPKFYLDANIPTECRIDWIDYFGPSLPSAKEIRDAPSDAAQLALKTRVVDDWRSRANWAKQAGLPADRDHAWKQICDRLVPSEYSVFQPILYSLDVALPLLDLRQERDWSPRVLDQNGAPFPPVFELPHAVPVLGGVWGLGHLVRAWEWLEIFGGWTLALIFASSVSGIIKTD